jgi:molybdopterin-guanine dinucleotide biosynthesis protein MobB
MIDYPLPLIGFSAFSGTGKTTLLTRLLPLLRAEGLRIGMVKHAHHNFDIDHPGKDSYELRAAGADQMLIVSNKRLAMIQEFHPPHKEPKLSQVLSEFNPEILDLILVEGFKAEHFPKIELHRPALGKSLMFPNDKDIFAIASDVSAEELNLNKYDRSPYFLNLNLPGEIAEFILEMISTTTRTSRISGAIT